MLTDKDANGNVRPKPNFLHLNLQSKERVGTIVVISIVVASYILFFIFQISSEFATLNEVFDSGKKEQLTSTQQTARILDLKFSAIENILSEMASSNQALQVSGATMGTNSIHRNLENDSSIDEMTISSVQQRLVPVNTAFEITIVDAENKIIGSKSMGVLGNSTEDLFNVGDVLDYPWAREVRGSHSPVFSGSYAPVTFGNSSKNNDVPIDERSKVISFAQPIFGQSRNYEGMILLTVPISYFVDDYSSVTAIQGVKEVALLGREDSDINNDRLAYLLTSNKEHRTGTLFDRDIKEIQSGSDPRSFFAANLKNLNEKNAVAISTNALGANANSVVFKNEDGEFLTSGIPIYSYGKPTYLLIVESDTADMYAKVEPILFQSRIQMFSVLAATAVLTVIIASFISRNINLDKKVREKTLELTESNQTIFEQKRQLEKANEELRHLDALKTQFIGIASHELKNPIQPIMLYAEMAKAGDVDKDEAIDIILRQAQRLAQLSKDILEVSRIDSKNLILNKQNVKIGDILQDVISPYQKALQGKPVSIDLEIDENTSMNLDVLRISQVINNIVQNALKFTVEGAITVRKQTVENSSNGGKTGKMVEVIISDSGLGIPQDILPNLFGKFVTKDVGNLNKQGTGLGLYICKGIIEAHGGKIWAENNADGRGATFYFSIPLPN